MVVEISLDRGGLEDHWENGSVHPRPGASLFSSPPLPPFLTPSARPGRNPANHLQAVSLDTVDDTSLIPLLDVTREALLTFCLSGRPSLYLCIHACMHLQLPNRQLPYRISL